MKYLVLLFVLALPAFADPITGYTVNGTGALSGPMQNLSDSPFWWADNTGSADALQLSSLYGYGPFQNGNAGGVGSYIISNPFTIDANSQLTVDYSFLTAQSTGGGCSCDYDVAILLENGQLYAILDALRPDGSPLIGEQGPLPDRSFKPPSPGVTTVSSPATGIFQGVLGNQQYGLTGDPNACPGCVINFESTLNAGPGDYQLLFGSFSVGGHGRHVNNSAVAVTNVQVPEPSSFYMAVCLLFLIPVVLRHKARQSRQAKTYL